MARNIRTYPRGLASGKRGYVCAHAILKMQPLDLGAFFNNNNSSNNKNLMHFNCMEWLPFRNYAMGMAVQSVHSFPLSPL